MAPLLPDSNCNICCDTLKNEKFSPHMKIHEKRFNLDASINCPSCQEHINKRQLNPHFEKVKDIRTKYSFLSFYPYSRLLYEM